MVVYTEYKIINDLMNETNNLYIECLENDLKVPSIFEFFKDEYHMRYKLNRLLIIGETSKLYISYIKMLLNTFPEGFGFYYFKYLQNQKINLTDIYYDLKQLSYNNNDID
jgi:hypothetical protein